MKQLQAISLFVIALLLIMHFSMSEVWPRLYLRMKAPAYLSSMVACLRAQDAFARASDVSPSLLPNEQHLLRLTTNVGLLECRERDRLRADLAANGVDPYELRLIDLDALDHGSVSLEATVHAYQP